MSAAQDGQRIVGDIIIVETTDDYSAAPPTWVAVGATTDSIETSPNTEGADNREQGEFQMQSDPVSEAWEIEFSANILSGPAQMQALGLLTNDFREAGHYDPGRAGTDAIQISVYKDQAAYDAGTVKYQLGTENYWLANDGSEINPDDYSPVSFVIHSRKRPVRPDLGGTYGSGGDGSGGTTT